VHVYPLHSSCMVSWLNTALLHSWFLKMWQWHWLFVTSDEGVGVGRTNMSHCRLRQPARRTLMPMDNSLVDYYRGRKESNGVEWFHGWQLHNDFCRRIKVQSRKDWLWAVTSARWIGPSPGKASEGVMYSTHKEGSRQSGQISVMSVFSCYPWRLCSTSRILAYLPYMPVWVRRYTSHSMFESEGAQAWAQWMNSSIRRHSLKYSSQGWYLSHFARTLAGRLRCRPVHTPGWVLYHQTGWHWPACVLINLLWGICTSSRYLLFISSLLHIFSCFLLLFSSLLAYLLIWCISEI
jgi:hypothetical protein